MDITTQALVAYVIAQAIQWAKRTPRLAFIRFNTAGLNRVVSIVLAGLSSLGLSWALTGSGDAGWQLIISIPAIGSLAGAFYTWAQQWLLQHVMYKVAVK